MQQIFCRLFASITDHLLATIEPFKISREITSEEDAKALIGHLNVDERRLLGRVLLESRDEWTSTIPSVTKTTPLTMAQSRQLFLVSALPFVGFGMLDNVILIVAGEYIDQSLGAALAISTMAAAALGNIISDVSGIGLAQIVEQVVARFGVRAPPMSYEQRESGWARMVAYLGRAIGVIFGCLIGMFPLLFYDHPSRHHLG